jgi:hypothetical protein
MGLGLAYALAWLGLADRDAARDRRASGGFHAVTAILVGYPLVWEATTRFAFLTPTQAAGAMTVLTAPALWIAWRRGAAFVGGAFATAAALSALALSFATKSGPLFSGWLTTLGVASLCVAYARGWIFLPWPAALAADVAALRVVLAGGAPGGEGSTILGVTPAAAEAAAAVLLAGYLATIAARTLWKRRNLGPFEMLQVVLVLLIGLGGATRVVRATGDDARLLGGAAMAAAAAAYLVAFLFVRRQLGRGRVFFFYGTLALVLALAGGMLSGGSATRTATWSALAVAAAVLGGRFDRVSLRAHAALYAAAAALTSGLLPATASALGGSRDAWTAHPWAAVAVAGSVGAYAALVATRSFRTAPRAARLPRFALAALGVAGIVGALGFLVSGAVPPGAALAAAGTVVLAAAAVALAWIARRSRLPELGWVTWALLAAGGAKLVLRDLGGGGSGGLFLAFGFYGAALLLAPRLLRPPT